MNENAKVRVDEEGVVVIETPATEKKEVQPPAGSAEIVAQEAVVEQALPQSEEVVIEDVEEVHPDVEGVVAVEVPQSSEGDAQETTEVPEVKAAEEAVVMPEDK